MDIVLFLSYLTENREESNRELLLHLESETDMRSTNGMIIAVKRHCTLQKDYLIFKYTGFFHIPNISLVFCIVAIRHIEKFRLNSGVFECFILPATNHVACI